MNFCDLSCKAEWQRTKKPVTKDWLVEKYSVLGMDCNQIAKVVKRDPKSVWNWLKDFQIPTRPRGGDTCPHSFKKGGVNPFLGRNHTPETRARLRAIALADGRVPYDPKVGSYMKGKRGAESTRWKGGITPDRQAHYSSEEWKRASKAVWKRDKAICQKCGLDKNSNREISFDIHHIKSFEHKELRSTVSNLVLLCEPCHYWVHSKKNKKDLFICR